MIFIFSSLLALICVMFYWFQLRPTWIRQDCSWIHVQKDAISAIQGDDSVVVPALIPKDVADYDTWDKYLSRYGKVIYTNSDEVQRLQSQKNGYPGEVAEDYWMQASDDEYQFCLQSRGLLK